MLTDLVYEGGDDAEDQEDLSWRQKPEESHSDWTLVVTILDGDGACDLV